MPENWNSAWSPNSLAANSRPLRVMQSALAGATVSKTETITSRTWNITHTQATIKGKKKESTKRLFV